MRRTSMRYDKSCFTETGRVLQVSEVCQPECVSVEACVWSGEGRVVHGGESVKQSDI